MTVSLGKRSIAEAVGTFILVFFGAGAAAVTLMLASGTTPSTPFNIGIGALGGLGDWLAIGLAFGIAIAGSIYALGRVSGCHINPAVTIALFATGRFPGRDVGPYIVAQLVGAAAASLLFAWAVGPDAVAIGGLGATAPFLGIGYLQAIVIEAVGTFLLMLVIMGAAVDERATPGFAGLAVGLAVAGIITATGNLTGASLNPARTFGPYLGDWLLAGQNLWALFPIYIIGPIIGAVLAAFLYDYLSGD
ncbi:MIP/aquaporin family protein [Methanoculleus sp. UBA303]|jgi:glycerol uptake facilitator protein|uniref:MIP/aquaporin family protein n=1 Tax=Methanoculleus sp. UBA303 TaxID=1915497 RepID=UPI0025E936D3|nr:MIP/aquaporin family protein [Methanoculleus sp. UBA303]MDD3932939.1 aquaporin family protein [Methanoculleus sp.]